LYKSIDLNTQGLTSITDMATSLWHGTGYIVNMNRKSAGILLFRFINGVPEVLLVHPGGPFWINKDIGAWSIPKGGMEEGESILDAAKRELEEETGIKTDGAFIELSSVKQGNKIIYAWAYHLNKDVEVKMSNSFELEWPPKSGNLKSFPEIDEAKWFSIDEAKIKINKGQVPLIIELSSILMIQSLQRNA
jgi:predicted NUDIX family NTP pyrophosphohydrolase